MKGFSLGSSSAVNSVYARLEEKEFERVEALALIEGARLLLTRLLVEGKVPTPLVSTYTYRYRLRQRRYRMIDLGAAVVTNFGILEAPMGMALDEEGTVWETMYTRLVEPIDCRQSVSEMWITNLTFGFRRALSLLPEEND